MAIYAFTLEWTKFNGYANPPWNLIGRVLTHVRHQRARLVIVAPVWKSQTCLLEMATRKPLLLPNVLNLIQPTHRVNQPDTTPRLATWAISGIDSEARRFLKELQSSYGHRGGRNQPKLTTLSLKNGLAGVVKEIQIPFQEI